MLDDTTPMILTYNEEANIERTLSRLLWARRILVVDSGSDDATATILSKYPQIDVIQRKFDSFADQCNFGLRHIDTEWVLSLDADYELSPELVEGLGALNPSAETGGYAAQFVYRILGRPLRGTLYPP